MDSTKTGNDKRLFVNSNSARNLISLDYKILTLTRKPGQTDGESKETCVEETAYLEVGLLWF